MGTVSWHTVTIPPQSKDTDIIPPQTSVGRLEITMTSVTHHAKVMVIIYICTVLVVF